MSDHPSIVSQLANEYAPTKVVYLPPDSRGHVASTAASEKYAGRPDVLAAAEDYFEDKDRLHGSKVCETTILREKPVHRMMIWLHAAGATAKEIAAQLDCTPQTVSQILRQPWAQKKLTEFLREMGQDKVRHFLTAQVSPSLDVLQEIRDTATARHSDRLAAAREILDRALGKPTVHVESSNTNKNVPADVQRLDAEIAAVRKQLEDKNLPQS